MATRYYNLSRLAQTSGNQITISVHDEYHVAFSDSLKTVAVFVLVDKLDVIHPYPGNDVLYKYFVDPQSPEWQAALKEAEEYCYGDKSTATA